MSSKKVEVIIIPIYKSIMHQYWNLYGVYPKENSVEMIILNELLELKKKLTVKEALQFSNLFFHLENDLIPKEQMVWRNFVFCHLVFLFEKRILRFNSWLLELICDVVTKENIFVANYFLEILSDESMMKKLFERVMYIDYKASLSNYYQIDFMRIKRIFTLLCRQIEGHIKKNAKESELEVIKKEIMIKIKDYQTNKIFKRSVRG